MFRSHIGVRPDSLAGDMAGLQAIRHIEIDQDRYPAPQEDIGGFDISMQISPFVEMGHGGAEVNRRLDRIRQRQLTMGSGIDQLA